MTEDLTDEISGIFEESPMVVVQMKLKKQDDFAFRTISVKNDVNLINVSNITRLALYISNGNNNGADLE